MSKKNNRCVTILPNQELHNKSTKHLIYILRRVTAVISSIHYHKGNRCCDICHEYIGDNWENDVEKYKKPYIKYKATIKSILKTREHVELDKKGV